MKAIIAVVASALVFLTVNAVIPTKSEAEIYNSTVRLHVLANSNEELDQSLKLKVYICIESAETTSPLNIFAISTAREVLPEAVGPTTTATKGLVII